MKAMVFNRYGSPDVLHMADVNRPEPGDNKLLVKVEASSKPESREHAETLAELLATGKIIPARRTHRRDAAC